MNIFSKNLKKLRRDNNLSQEQLADKLSVSRQAISKWESGVAYPEMEKIVQLCQEFDVNVDDLLNKDVREVKNEKEGRKVSRGINNFLQYFVDFFNMFFAMNGKTKIKFIVEQVILMLLFWIVLAIIGNWIYVLTNTESSLMIFYNTYNMFAAIIVIALWLPVMNARYLSYYRKAKGADDSAGDANIELTDKTRIVIRDPKHSEHYILRGVAKVLVLAVKICLLTCAAGMASLVIMAVAGLVMVIAALKPAMFSVGAVIGLFGVATIAGILTLILINLVFNRKSAKKILIIAFFVALVLMGAGIGLAAIGGFKIERDCGPNYHIVSDFVLNEDKCYIIR